MVKIMIYQYTMDKTCPLCKKQVKAIKLERKTAPVSNTDWSNEIFILGCPECHNVFFHEEVNPFLKK